MYDRNITIFLPPGTDIWRQEMSELSYPFPELAEKLYITSSYEEYKNITKYYVLKKESFFYHYYD